MGCLLLRKGRAGEGGEGRGGEGMGEEGRGSEGNRREGKGRGGAWACPPPLHIISGYARYAGASSFY